MKKIFVALLLALVAASPAGAQSSTNDSPSIIPRAKPATSDHEGTFKGDVARRFTDEFAACVLGRRHRPVMEALALPSGSEEQGKALGSLGVKECIASGGELNFSAWTFRGSLYTALVRTQFSRKAASIGPEPVDYTKQPPAGNETLPVQEVAELLNFTSCVIHKDTENARSAIIATAGSPAETAAMADLGKVYGQCLYADQTLKFSKGELKGLLAEAYYREGSAPVQSSAASPGK